MSEPVRLTEVIERAADGYTYSAWYEPEGGEAYGEDCGDTGTWYPDDGNEAAREVAGDLVDVLEKLRAELSAVPADTFGSGVCYHEAPDGEVGACEWSRRDELIGEISDALAKARGEASDG